tara:strand:- start:486 stop:629 length:144 start_codon:yes stop_codon:yes gene_type:complete
MKHAKKMKSGYGMSNHSPKNSPKKGVDGMDPKAPVKIHKSHSSSEMA